jgi:hypothetical protein
MCCGGYERFVTDAQVARRLGVTRERVGGLASRADFPPSGGRIEPAPLWRWREVQAWARRTGAAETAQFAATAR